MTKSRFYAFAFALAVFSCTGSPVLVSAQSAEIETPAVILTDVPFDVKVSVTDLEGGNSIVSLLLGGSELREVVRDGEATFEGVMLSSTAESTIRILHAGQEIASATPMVLPGWASILPALIAIVVALVF